MADLPMYEDFESKREYFSNGHKPSFIIDTKDELDRWFKDVDEEDKSQKRKSATALIYRGMTEAKYKIFTASQRLWIRENMTQWAGKPYLEFINDVIQTAKESKLINTVFKIYNYNDKESDFPILSLLQHYGAPTSLIDWSYNQNVAIFFGVNGIKKSESPRTKQIDNYFSVYRINKTNYFGEFLNIRDILPKEYPNPSLSHFFEQGDSQDTIKDSTSNTVYYLSDFEYRGESTGKRKGNPFLRIRTGKPLTSAFNQNIIPQVGLFIFNPYSEKSLEEIFHPDVSEGGPNLHLHPFECYNIHKDLSMYLQTKIDVKYKINTKFIYPQLNDVAFAVKEEAIKNLIPNYNNNGKTSRLRKSF
jgi:hypothetical protein